MWWFAIGVMTGATLGTVTAGLLFASARQKDIAQHVLDTVKWLDAMQQLGRGEEAMANLYKGLEDFKHGTN